MRAIYRITAIRSDDLLCDVKARMPPKSLPAAGSVVSRAAMNSNTAMAGESAAYLDRIPSREGVNREVQPITDALTAKVKQQASTQVGQELTKINDVGQALDAITAKLIERLAPVTREEPVSPVQSANSQPPQEYLVPLADRLRREREGIDGSLRRLASLLSRLEV